MANKDLFKRILFIIFAVPLVIFILFFNTKYNLLIFLFAALLTILSSLEFCFCLKNKNLLINRFLFIFQILFILLIFFLFSNKFISASLFFFLLITCLLITTFFYIFKKDIINNSLAMFLHLFGLFYISIPISTILLFYNLIKNAANLFLFFLLIVWSSNIFGYLVGLYWLPRNPLYLEVSPNKSKKGFFGAIFFGTFIPFLLTFLFNNFFNFHPIKKTSLLLLIFLTNIFSIMGDLFESAFKRFCGVKDSSNYLQGFGGILDSIDSILFAFPFYFSFLLFLFNIKLI